MFYGHQKTYQSLQENFRLGRLSHALLFYGPEGIGKFKLAFELARFLLCQTQENNCHCPSCQLFAKAQHPDLILVDSQGERIKIDEIREIKKSFVIAPLIAARRVILIRDAHNLNVAAANALLKSLEEPPAETYFLLTSHALGALPKTIVSRCRRVSLSPLASSDLQKIAAAENLAYSAESLDRAMGSISRLARLSEIGDKIPPLRKLFPSREALGFDELYELVQNIVEEDKSLAWLTALESQVHEALTRHLDLKPSLRFALLTFSDKILQTRRELKQNANPKIVLTRLFMFFQEAQESRL